MTQLLTPSGREPAVHPDAPSAPPPTPPPAWPPPGPPPAPERDWAPPSPEERHPPHAPRSRRRPVLLGAAAVALLAIVALLALILGSDGSGPSPRAALTEDAVAGLLARQDAALEDEDMQAFRALFASGFRIRYGQEAWSFRGEHLSGWRENMRDGRLTVVSATSPEVRTLGDQALAKRTVVYRYKPDGEPAFVSKYDEVYRVAEVGGALKLTREQDYGYLVDYMPLLASEVPARVTVLGVHDGEAVVRATRVFRSAEGTPRWFIPVNEHGRRTLSAGDRVRLTYHAVNVDTGEDVTILPSNATY
jgi:hypothetical protein